MMPRIKLLDQDGNVLYEGVLYRLPLREEEIILYGQAFYGIPELCVMRREAMRKHILMELEDKALAGKGNEEVCIEELGELRRFVNF